MASVVRVVLSAVLGAAVAGALWAEGVSTSPRPEPRPPAQITPEEGASAGEAVASGSAKGAAAEVPRPEPRPEVAAPAPQIKAETAPLTLASPRPRARPAGLVRTAAASAPEAEAAPAAPKPKRTRKGSVCGDADIKGEALEPITSRTNGCGIAEPVKVTAVDGVVLNPAATISCETASALKDWINGGMRPAFGTREVVELRIAGSYACRSRNNVRGAKISEHGKGRAIDISAFVLGSGEIWTVVSNYNKTMRKAYKAACGIFGTTLGPGSDGYHEDHLHFDIARHSNGPYCR